MKQNTDTLKVEGMSLDGIPIRKRVKNCAECIFLQRSSVGFRTRQYCSIGFEVEITKVVAYRVNTWEDEFSEIKPQNGVCLKTARASGRRKTFGWLRNIGREVAYLMSPAFPRERIQGIPNSQSMENKL